MALEPGTWKHELRARLRTLWMLKMFSTMGGIALFFYAYFWVMRHPLSAVTVMPATRLDDLVAFSPHSFFLYVSLWAYVALSSALLKDAQELAAWGAASLVMIVVGLGIFLALPTKVPDPAIDWSRYPSLQFLKTVDVSGNACPSLHAAFAVFSAVVLHRALAAVRSTRTLLVFNLAWGLGIVYSTVATRQHVVLDVIAGSLLAAAGAVAYIQLIVIAESRRARLIPDQRQLFPSQHPN